MDRLDELLVLASKNKTLSIEEKAELNYLLMVVVENKNSHYVALCPWHKENTPSFTINTEKNTFHCFGCGKSGKLLIEGD